MKGLVIFRFDAQLIFANTRAFREQVAELVDRNPGLRWLVVAAEPITDVDTTAADTLKDLDEELNARGISLVFAEMKDPVRRKIERYELTRTIDPRHFFPTIGRRSRPSNQRRAKRGNRRQRRRRLRKKHDVRSLTRAARAVRTRTTRRAAPR